ncbi:MAG: carbamate kinase [Spirochaetes bacterium]|nr:carbamate kinase [Spirochaetota bacterium]
MGKLALIAIGGNSLIKDEEHKTVKDQYKAICETAVQIADIIEEGYDVILTHGNGPQVGFILRRSELAHEIAGMHIVPLVSCVADTQGAIGYQLQQALNNEFKKRGITKHAVTVVTQVEVDRNDQAFSNPTKPIGSFFSEELIKGIRKIHPDWHIVYDSGRGYRRVVASPAPKKIIEIEVIKALVKEGFCVIGVGGGGIPVFQNESGDYEGVDAVIDKDSASCLLASRLKADLFIISTSVEKICLQFGKPDQKPLDRINDEQARKYIDEGHFAPGSMLPKIKAVLYFLEHGGKEAIITAPGSLARAVKGESGTHIHSK